MVEISDLNVVADNNNAAPPDGFPENMNYSDVNNAARELMALLARWYADTNGSLIAAGTANALTLTTNAAYAALFDGFTLRFQAAAANTSAATLAVNALGAQALVDADGNALVGGELQAGRAYDVVYDSGASAFRLQNASRTIAGAGTFGNILLSGNTITTTDTNGALTLDPNGTGAVNVTGDFLQQSGTFQALGNAFFRGTGLVDMVDGNAALVVGGVGSQPHIEMDANNIQAKTDATTSATMDIQEFGGNVRIGSRTAGAGGVFLYRDQTQVLNTETTGVALRGATNINARYEIDDTTGTRRAVLGFAGSDTLTIENEVAASDVNVVATGTVRLRGAGELRLETETNGVSVAGPADNRQQLFFVTQNGITSRGFVGFVATDILEIENEVDGGNVQISASDAGGTTRNILIADPDGATSIYHPDTDTNAAITTQQLIGNNSTAATVRHRSGVDVDVGVGVFPLTEITANTTLDGTHVQQALIWRAGAITFPNDTDIPIGARGLIIADFDVLNATLQLAPASGITLSLQNGLGNQNITTLTPSDALDVGDGGVVEWLKRANTQYHVWGTDVVLTPP